MRKSCGSVPQTSREHFRQFLVFLLSLFLPATTTTATTTTTTTTAAMISILKYAALPNLSESFPAENTQTDNQLKSQSAFNK